MNQTEFWTDQESRVLVRDMKPNCANIKKYRALLLAMALTVFLRITCGLFIFDHISGKYSWHQDDEYSNIAHTLVTSEKYGISENSPPTMKRMPAYPLILAGIYSIFGKSVVAVRVFQALICSITCLLIYLTAREVSTSQRVAEIASFIFAFYPNSVIYSARILTETVYCLFLALFCFTLVKYYRNPSISRSIGSGLAFGTLMLTKGTTILLPVFMLLLLLFPSYRERSRIVLGHSIWIVGVGALLMSPWIIRNYTLTNNIVLLSTRGGPSLYQGYYFSNHLMSGRTGLQLDRDAWMEIRTLVNERYSGEGVPSDEYFRDRVAYSLALEKIGSAPGRSLCLFVRNLFFTWFLSYSGKVIIVNFFVHIPLLLLSAYGAIVMFKRDRSVWVGVLPLLMICFYFNLLHGAYYPHVRYMFPVSGTILTILSAYGLLHLGDMSKRLPGPKGPGRTITR